MYIYIFRSHKTICKTSNFPFKKSENSLTSTKNKNKICWRHAKCTKYHCMRMNQVSLTRNVVNFKKETTSIILPTWCSDRWLWNQKGQFRKSGLIKEILNTDQLNTSEWAPELHLSKFTWAPTLWQIVSQPWIYIKLIKLPCVIPVMYVCTSKCTSLYNTCMKTI